MVAFEFTRVEYAELSAPLGSDVVEMESGENWARAAGAKARTISPTILTILCACTSTPRTIITYAVGVTDNKCLPARRVAIGAVWAVMLVAGQAMSRQDTQRIPRQTAPSTAALLGIMRNTLGQGLGGVRIRIVNRSSNQTVEAVTGGDGVFRVLNLAGGTYELSAAMEGFEALVRGGIELEAGDAVAIEGALKAIAPELPVIRLEPPVTEVYRVLPSVEGSATVVEAIPVEALAPADKVFVAAPNRWKYDWPTYHRYGPPGESPYVTGRFFDPFNRNKLKGDYPIIGQRTFLNVTLTSDTFVDGRRLPTSASVASAYPDATISSGISASSS